MPRLRLNRLALLLVTGIVLLVAVGTADGAAATTAGDGPTTSRASTATVEREILRRVNAIRARLDRKPLRRVAVLNRIARQQSAYQARLGDLTHDGADGSSAGDRIMAVIDTRVAGETVAVAGGAAAIVSLWMNSPPHRRLLLSPSFRHAGIGVRNGSYGGGPARYATVDLAD